MTALLIILLIPLTIGLLWALWTYNQLVKWKNMVQEAWSGIDVQLKRRWDLIPNLLETVKGYAAHEKEVLYSVTEARSHAQRVDSQGDGHINSRDIAETVLTDSLKHLFMVAEAYPDLKANENFLNLHHSLVQIEDELQMARRYYNGAVRQLNTLIESFPSNLLAQIFRFHSADFFQLDTRAEREAPRVSVSP